MELSRNGNKINCLSCHATHGATLLATLWSFLQNVVAAVPNMVKEFDNEGERWKEEKFYAKKKETKVIVICWNCVSPSLVDNWRCSGLEKLLNDGSSHGVRTLPSACYFNPESPIFVIHLAMNMGQPFQWCPWNISRGIWPQINFSFRWEKSWIEMVHVIIGI